MNLHAVVANIVAAVNPLRPVTVQTSTGYTTSATGARTPTYAAPVMMMAQVQELTRGDLQHLDALNIQGSQRVIYLSGFVEGVVRWSQKGGDLITMDEYGTVWLTTAVLEQWHGWVKVSVTLQDGS